MAVSALHERLRNVVPDLYCCDLSRSSASPTAEHTSTVTKQHRFKRLPGDYILKWMTGSSLWRDTLSSNTSSPPRVAERACNGGGFFTADRQLLAQGAQKPASKDRTKVPPSLTSGNKMQASAQILHMYLFLHAKEGLLPSQISVLAQEESVEILWLSSLNGPTIPINPPGFALFSASANTLLWREMS